MKKPSVSNETATRLAEDELYAFVYEEIENGQMDKAAQARAIAEGGGDEGAVRAAYIKHRIARIKAEIEFSVAKAENDKNISIAKAEREKEIKMKKLQKEEERRVKVEFENHKQNRQKSQESNRKEFISVLKTLPIALMLGLLAFALSMYLIEFFYQSP